MVLGCSQHGHPERVRLDNGIAIERAERANGDSDNNTLDSGIMRQLGWMASELKPTEKICLMITIWKCRRIPGRRYNLGFSWD